MFWRKAIYKEWFEYAKISPLGYPTEFGDLSLYTFEEWFTEIGFDLFAEPPIEVPLQKVLIKSELPENTEFQKLKSKSLKTITPATATDKNTAFLMIDLEGDRDSINLIFDNFLNNNLKEHTEIKSKAMFQPSKKPEHIKIATLKKYREAYIMREVEHKTRQQVLKSQGEKFITIDKERAVSRSIATVRTIFDNIKRGMFP